MGYNDKNQESKSSDWFLVFNGFEISKAINHLKCGILNNELITAHCHL